MKRYALFAGETYYPWGGWMDLVGLFDDLEGATERLAGIQVDTGGVGWWHIIDLADGTVALNCPEEEPWRDAWTPWMKR